MLHLTRSEVDLLQAIHELCYGELYAVAFGLEEKTVHTSVSSQQSNLISALREYGFLEKIIVHDSEPTFAERKFVKQKYQGIQRIKL